MATHISYRLSWNNGSNSGANISISYWRWRAGRPPPNVPCARYMQVSSVRTALEHHYFARTVVWRLTGVPHSIGHLNGLQPTTVRSLSNHLDLCYSLGMVVYHVQELLRYVHIQAFNMCLC